MKTLTSTAVERYHRDGFYFPIPVLTPDEARDYRRRLEAVEAAHGGTLTAEIRQKPHLLFTWLADLVRHPAILVEGGFISSKDDMAKLSSIDYREQIAAAITEGIFHYRDLVKQRPATIAVTPGITE